LKRIQRPSPGLVIAVIALFAALSGAAFALPGKNSVDSGDVKKNTLKGKDIKESTLGRVPSASTANGLAAGVPQVSAWAKVSAGGSATASSGVLSVSNPSEGFYCFDLAQPAATGTATGGGTSNFFRTIASLDVPANPGSSACTGSQLDANVITETDGAFNNQEFSVVFVK
jgi:hypothetical protein